MPISSMISTLVLETGAVELQMVFGLLCTWIERNLSMFGEEGQDAQIDNSGSSGPRSS